MRKNIKGLVYQEKSGFLASRAWLHMMDLGISENKDVLRKSRYLVTLATNQQTLHYL